MKKTWFQTIESIKKTFQKNGMENYSKLILKDQLEGGTGGEVLDSVCSTLLKIKGNDQDAYQIIHEEADELIGYAHSIGYHPQ